MQTSSDLRPARLQQPPEAGFSDLVDVQHDRPSTEGSLKHTHTHTHTHTCVYAFNNAYSPGADTTIRMTVVRYPLLRAALQGFSPAHGSQRQPPLLGGDGGQRVQDGAAAPLVLVFLEHTHTHTHTE